MESLEEIKGLVKKGEGKYIEFKEKTVNLEKMVKELVAFANSAGGQLLVGVADDGSLAGLKHPEEDLYVLRDAIKYHVVPYFRYEPEIIDLNNEESILRVRVPESGKKPHFFRPAPGKYGDAFVRVDDKCVRASREMKNLMRLQKINRNQTLTLGEVEKKLLEVLEERGSATLEDMMEAARMKRKEVSERLVRLAAAGILRLEPRRGAKDIFLPAEGH